MIWRVVVPIKQPGTRKSRLAGSLDAAARDELAERMFHHVMRVIAMVPDTVPVALSPTRPAGWQGAWLADWDAVNPMLATLRHDELSHGFCVINADLPLLCRDDVSAMLAAAAQAGIAIAPDRAGSGTNAVALAPGNTIGFHFGPDSFAAFSRAAGTPARTVKTPGLATDVDYAEDIAAIGAICPG